MINDQAALELDGLATAERNRVASILPLNTADRFVIYTEALRQIDYWSVFQKPLPPESRLKPWDMEIIWLGLNSATAYLLTKLPQSKGFPLVTPTREGRESALKILHQLGRATLMRRVAEMVRHKYANAERTEDGWTIQGGSGVLDQFLDNIEFSRWATLERRLSQLQSGQPSMGWMIFGRDELDQVAGSIGRFLSSKGPSPLAQWLRCDIDELMRPLLFPWDSGYGVMTGYGALPEVDCHFLAKALLLVTDWREDAGFHPDANVAGVRVRDLTMVVAAMASLHLKHIHFVLLAGKSRPEISISESFTIWTPREEIEETICGLTFMDKEVVRKILSAIALHPDDVPRISSSTNPVMPLLVDLGNGLMLRPISSICRNPFNSIRDILESRGGDSRNCLSAPREGWLRADLYGQFCGNRYFCVPGNIKLRDGRKTVTDVDAAIFDRTTGELALFQIKWQDFSTNDVRQLRSRASNLSREMDDWAAKVEQWLDGSSKERLAKTFRLKLDSRLSIVSVRLFGISRTVARTKGFGFATQHPRLAVMNWPHFCRLRTEIGPSANVISDLHKALLDAMTAEVQSTPLPFTMRVAGTPCHFENLWNAFSGERDPACTQTSP
ncbi:hypothetical protein N5B55_00020 [Ralstonia pickettii]|uniref:hypothetical protein n=1 Tax=Ralstonia pickettii TaxID=329 RepID=UPI002714E21F|nr:hypothetical protein [Ralstonia pickettii]WKZ85377.1 hypothetical protein N5B55_00020 [Ralstonia pickettii]